MSQHVHTYGPNCHLAPRNEEAAHKPCEEMPEIRTQFFYCSSITLDDPLGAVPPPTSDSKAAKHPPKPFSPHDNEALQKAWAGLGSSRDRRNHKRTFKTKGSSPASPKDKHGCKKHRETNSEVCEEAVGCKHTEQKPGKGSVEPKGYKGNKGKNDITEPVPAPCPCKSSHLGCRNAPGKCTCTSCPKGPANVPMMSSSAPEPFHNPKKKSHEAEHIGHGEQESKKGDTSHKKTKEVKPKKSKSKSKDKTHSTDDQESATHGEAEAEPGHAEDCPCGHLDHDTSSESEEEYRCGHLDHASEVRPTDTRAPSCCGDTTGQAPTKQEPVDGSDVGKPSGPSSPTWCCADLEKDNKGHGEAGTTKGKGHDPKEPSVTAPGPEKKTADKGKGTEAQSSKPGKKAKGKYKLFGKQTVEDNQTDGANDDPSTIEDLGLYGQDTYGDVDTGLPTLDQGDATNDNHGTGSQVLTAGDGNTPMKTTELGTTGKPFLKLPARSDSPVPLHAPMHESEPTIIPRKTHERDSTEDLEVEGCKAHKHKEQVNIPVGYSRLHEVSLPSLQMKPIYWSPLHDVASCIYGTWFYKDSMYPVEPAVANQLEIGYRELQCWSQTWKDELNSAIEVGAAGEEKIAHRLWPAEEKQKASKSDSAEHLVSADPYCAARCFHGEAAAEGKGDELEAKPTPSTSIPKKYPNSQVIYKNACEAFILRPTVQPSEYYGRKPLAKIMKNMIVGIPVVRGFDWGSWEKLHPSKKTQTTIKTSHKTGVTAGSKPDCCPACEAQEKVPEYSDLCLVIHGIGQKLSERMESFHFTHAINGFRTEVNRELFNPDVKRVLREDLCGFMVLPVNWRQDLVFEDGGPNKAGDKDDSESAYTLNDITLPTIPAVRGLICDVMLDIPYYLSKHKPKMIAALIAEANRIYRLWCKNNPGFHKKGRVHLIAHSLGSVMALEVLSKQPTSIPAELSWRTNTKCFDFRTTNCFLAGSPASFFLLLDNAHLCPRKALNKPGAESGDDTREDVVGEVGTFGCLAVDNIYNIMHINDPIAYRLNATVDAPYASSLKVAEVPNSSLSFFGSVGHAFKSLPGISSPTDLGVGQLPKPAMLKMPSQVEMAVHDFSAEEIAEKKFCLLNDNGQVDWCLGNRGGMLDNQYINMLSAHSCYWTHRDFIRMLCVEVGRKAGRENTLPDMRAVKKSRK
ncbi:hypothetical protein CJF32_00009282 [Rutstroemia sp. NJR-2017a WRK4]|nr:hypothetical protein CJF32_00009282 [Rutstroemia sp. NJR-2017a WRK4]